ncbi:MAG: hypothetical protein U0Q03_00670 [Acidimicrobiales bacterium]
MLVVSACCAFRQVLDSPAAQEWLLLGDEGAEIGHANWVHLTA